MPNPESFVNSESSFVNSFLSPETFGNFSPKVPEPHRRRVSCAISPQDESLRVVDFETQIYSFGFTGVPLRGLPLKGTNRVPLKAFLKGCIRVL